MLKKFLIVLPLVLCGCVPAIIGVSFALGGATVGVTYEILGDDDRPLVDGGPG